MYCTEVKSRSEMSVVYRMGTAKQNRVTHNRGPENSYLISVSALRPEGNPSGELANRRSYRVAWSPI